ncbi:hypothetical protein MJD09_04135 [bacterium]|nr:hypothetical protein [bacterium]
MKYSKESCWFLVVLITSIGCGGGLKMNSNWREHEIQIDGTQSDWHGALTFIEKKNVSVGITNDKDFLYMAFAAGDPAQRRQFMMRGLVLWLDAKGGDKKTVGIRFPVGLLGRGEGFGMRRPDQEFDPEIMGEAFEQSLAELEIIGPEKDKKQRYRVGELAGVEVKIGDPVNSFFYELKIPLDKTKQYPFAIALEPGETLGVGFETPEFDRDAMRERMGRGGFGGGRGGFGGGRGGFGGGRGRGGGGRQQMMQNFELWMSVQLSLEGDVTSIRALPTESDTNPAVDRELSERAASSTARRPWAKWRLASF